MGLLADFMTALSADVVSALAAGSYPPLVDGRILFGPARQFEGSRPPRIIVTPVGSVFGPPDLYSASATLGTTERRQQAVMKAQHSERVTFEVRCWGGDSAGSLVADYDLTRALYHAVLASLQRLAPNHGLDKQGAYTTAGPLTSLGREFVFTTWLDMPVLDTLIPYDNATLYAPATVAPVLSDTFIASTGETGSGC
jgi:hypothetical protein